MSHASATARRGRCRRSRPFRPLARDWWDEKGPMKPLHKINPVRVAFLKQRICAHFGRDPRALDALAGLTILDIGCGGGILSEPLARMGATVTGVDPASEQHPPWPAPMPRIRG
jgi:2-polyprenyl-6-hydroxyphenyl methylase/3-demethylubiquinone-9 3-methyltransferase